MTVDENRSGDGVGGMFHLNEYINMFVAYPRPSPKNNPPRDVEGAVPYESYVILGWVYSSPKNNNGVRGSAVRVQHIGKLKGSAHR